MFNLKQLISNPTRVTNNYSSILDHIICNTGISDHCVICCTRKINNRVKCKHVKIRSMRNYNKEIYKNKLREIDWSDVTLCNDVNNAWLLLKQEITTIIDSIAPMKSIRIKVNTEPWMTGEILEMINTRSFVLSIQKRQKQCCFIQNVLFSKKQC